MNNLEMTHFRVSFSLEFTLPQGEVNYSNLFSFFPRKKMTWFCSLCHGDISL